MTLPAYNKSKRRQTFQQLPKGAYVVKFTGAKNDQWPDGHKCIKMAFDIEEGPYKGIYQNLFNQRRSKNENAQWPLDGIFTLDVPYDGCDEYIWTNWNTFFADLEDSNSGFIFNGDLKKLKGKIIGGKFRIKQSRGKTPDKDGNYPIFNNVEMKYSCVAEDVRQGKAGKLPKDKLIANAPAPSAASSAQDLDGFVNLPDGSEEELPF